MTLTQLKYAIEVANAGSINKAAGNLFITQPSLSSAIAELEAEIGIKLFSRNNRGIFLTPEGSEFVGYARQVVEQFDLIEAKYISNPSLKKKFSVSMQHYTFAVSAFVNLVKQFGMDEYEFAVNETKTYDVINDVKTFKSEIGILYINDFNKNILTKLFKDSNLIFTPLMECSIYVYLYKNHPLAGHDKIKMDELMDYPCLSFEQGEYNSFYFAEEVLYGLKRDVAIKIAAKTLLGSAAQILETNIHPACLKDMVCSPSGTTIEGVRALEEHNFRAGVIEAVSKATLKSQ